MDPSAPRSSTKYVVLSNYIVPMVQKHKKLKISRRSMTMALWQWLYNRVTNNNNYIIYKLEQLTIKFYCPKNWQIPLNTPTNYCTSYVNIIGWCLFHPCCSTMLVQVVAVARRPAPGSAVTTVCKKNTVLRKNIVRSSVDDSDYTCDNLERWYRNPLVLRDYTPNKSSVSFWLLQKSEIGKKYRRRSITYKCTIHFLNLKTINLCEKIPNFRKLVTSTLKVRNSKVAITKFEFKIYVFQIIKEVGKLSFKIPLQARIQGGFGVQPPYPPKKLIPFSIVYVHGNVLECSLLGSCIYLKYVLQQPKEYFRSLLTLPKYFTLLLMQPGIILVVQGSTNESTSVLNMQYTYAIIVLNDFDKSIIESAAVSIQNINTHFTASKRGNECIGLTMYKAKAGGREIKNLEKLKIKHNGKTEIFTQLLFLTNFRNKHRKVAASLLKMCGSRRRGNKPQGALVIHPCLRTASFLLLG
ncbi:hypothetical protein AGLY_007825 [Aphis glycines]|uniref:Uncharacterized protein n=1 Tax=Aphis glycines TaxID=307491 RepID=A0A6G0TP04_APHGL|nr:hypothetical protein AGLY_007825 [Aphis glycines]